MDLFLDGNGPLYAQLVRSLKTAMANGRIANGSRLPPSRELATTLGLSRSTVVAAYEQLRAEGFIQGKVGAGSYVTSPWPTVARPPLARRPMLAQSAYSRRARQLHDHSELPGRRIPGMRHAFQYGLPVASPRLMSAWVRELARAAPYIRPNYPVTQGLPALREALCAHIARSRGVACLPEDLLITSGTQQAMNLVTRVLLDPGDEVVMEDPQYSSTRKIFQLHGANVTGVPVDHDGLCVDALPPHPVKLVCVTPSHQFPTGAVLSLPRRHQLLEHARQCGGWIVEDDYDGEFRHEAHAVPALQSLDRNGCVIYVGSFSKTLFPALRLGYLVMPPGLREDFIAAKWADDFGSPALEQAALAQLIAGGTYERHLAQATRKLAERRQALRDALAHELRRPPRSAAQPCRHAPDGLASRHGRGPGRRADRPRPRTQARPVFGRALLPAATRGRRLADGLRRHVRSRDPGCGAAVRQLPARLRCRADGPRCIPTPSHAGPLGVNFRPFMRTHHEDEKPGSV